MKEFDAALAIDGNYVFALSRKIAMLRLQGRDGEGEALERFMSLDAQDGVLKALSALRKKGLSDGDDKYFTRAVEKFPDSLGIRREAAWALLGLKRYEEALALFDRILVKNPADEDGYLGKSIALYHLNRAPEAFSVVEEGLKHLSTNVYLLNQVGWLHHSLEKYDKAVETYRRTLSVDAGNLFALQNMLRSLSALARAGETYDFDEAENFARGALQLHPGNTELPGEFGWLLLARKKYDEAFEYFIKAGDEIGVLNVTEALRIARRFSEVEKLIGLASEKFKSSVNLITERGLMFSDQEQYEKALEFFNEAIRRDPENTLAFRYKIMVLRFGLRYDEAEAAFLAVPPRVSDDPYILNEVAALFYQRRLYEKTAKTCDKVIALNKGATDQASAFAISLKVDALRMRGRAGEPEFLVEAAKLADDALLVSPTNPLILNQRGWLYIDCGELKKAIEEFDKAAANAAGWFMPAFGRADALHRFHRTDEALRSLVKLKETYPGVTEVQNYLGWFYLNNNDLANAKKEFREILNRDPKSVMGHSGIGGVFFKEEDYECAEKNFRHVMRVSPNEPTFYVNLAWALLRQGTEGDMREAEDLCRRALALDPFSAADYGCLGVIAFKRGKLRQSEEFLRESTSVSPNEGSYTDLGALYIQMGRYEEAEVQLKKALEINRDDTQDYIEMGNLHLQNEKIKEALRQFRKAVAIDPLNEEAHRSLGGRTSARAISWRPRRLYARRSTASTRASVGVSTNYSPSAHDARRHRRKKTLLR